METKLDCELYSRKIDRLDIDSRIILWIVFILLEYLFLKAVGVLP